MSKCQKWFSRSFFLSLFFESIISSSHVQILERFPTKPCARSQIAFAEAQILSAEAQNCCTQIYSCCTNVLFLNLSPFPRLRLPLCAHVNSFASEFCEMTLSKIPQPLQCQVWCWLMTSPVPYCGRVRFTSPKRRKNSAPRRGLFKREGRVEQENLKNLNVKQRTHALKKYRIMLKLYSYWLHGQTLIWMNSITVPDPRFTKRIVSIWRNVHFFTFKFQVVLVLTHYLAINNKGCHDANHDRLKIKDFSK